MNDASKIYLTLKEEKKDFEYYVDKAAVFVFYGIDIITGGLIGWEFEKTSDKKKNIMTNLKEFVNPRNGIPRHRCIAFGWIVGRVLGQIINKFRTE